MRGEMVKSFASICLIVLLCAAAAAGCGRGESPAEIVNRYIEAVKHHDLSEVYELLCQEDRERYPEDQVLQGFHLAEHQEEAVNKLGAVQLRGDTAWVEVITLYDEGISVQKIVLLKEGGRWKISLSRTIAEALKQKEAQAHSHEQEEGHQEEGGHESEPGHEEGHREEGGHESEPGHGGGHEESPEKSHQQSH